MLIAAPSDAARPTNRAACEPARKAAAKIGASVEMVPSIRPIRDGWMKRKICPRSPCRLHRSTRSVAVRETAIDRSLRIASTDVAATNSGTPIVVSIALRTAGASCVQG